MTTEFPRAPVNILLVDDQPAKLMSYELILEELGQTLLKASSAKQALEILLKTEVAVILVDVCMPELDGFELAQMIREHPRFQDTAIIFISAIHLSDLDSLKGYEMGAVDYVPVPVAPRVLRAKVRVFVDLYRKTRELAHLNQDLEARVTERTAELEAAMAHQEMLAREVDHRARNALAVIQAIVSMTAAGPSPDFARAIEGRIQAMARAHTLLSQTRWQGADLATLVAEELAPFAGERITVDGDPILIRPSTAQTVALVLHELATNAAKHGALSGASGKLAVSWRLGKNNFTLQWTERCGRAIVKPERTGFGAKVIESSTLALDGEAKLDWEPDGLRCTLHIPARHFEAPVGARRRKLEPVHEDYPAVGDVLQGSRLLIVEDEPLVAMMLVNLVTDLGGAPVGPCPSIGEAYALLNQPFDAALLDINVAGEMSYALAAEIDRMGAPIVFLTGYEADSIDPRFAHAGVLTKPVDPKLLAVALTAALEKRKSEALAG